MNGRAVLVILLVGATTCSALAFQEGSCPGPRPDVLQRTVDLTYAFTVVDIPARANCVAVWLPIPLSNARQRLEDLCVASDWRYLANN